MRGPNAFETRLKCICHEKALSVTRQTCTWNCPVFVIFKKVSLLRMENCYRVVLFSMAGVLWIWLPALVGRKVLNKLKTTPTPNKNGSYGVKVGVRMP